jgi:type I restriction enzyme S subunit
MTFLSEQHIRASVPAPWSVRRLKVCAEIASSNIDKHTIEGEPEVRLCNYLDVYNNRRITSKIEFMTATATTAQIDRLTLSIGDVVVTKDSESPWDIAVPAFVAERIPGLVCGYHLAKLTPNSEKMTGEYLAWALRSDTVSIQLSLSAQGITRYGLSSSTLGDTYLPCPSTYEQATIASYLNSEIARIDALIEDKNSLVKILFELRMAILDELIHGLVPRGWTVKRLKFLLKSVRQGWSPQAEGRPAEEWEWGVLKAGVCNGGVFHSDEHKALPSEIEPDPELEIREGDILMSRGSGSADLVGSVAIVGSVRPRLLLCDLLYRLEIENLEEVSPEWLVFALNSTALRRQIRLALRGAEGLTRKITSSAIKELTVSLPSYKAQQSIVSEFKLSDVRIGDLVAQANAEIALLKELRSATITDAILGRLVMSREALGGAKTGTVAA